MSTSIKKTTAMTQPPPLGIQRLIERHGRAPLIQIEELVCPGCGHLTRVEWEQESLRDPSLPTATQTHCIQRGCRGYYMTSDVPTFFERFGSTTPESQSASYPAKEETT